MPSQGSLQPHCADPAPVDWKNGGGPPKFVAFQYWRQLWIQLFVTCGSVLFLLKIWFQKFLQLDIQWFHQQFTQQGEHKKTRPWRWGLRSPGSIRTCYGLTIIQIPGLVNIEKTNWKDPPCYAMRTVSWVYTYIYISTISTGPWLQ